MVLSSGRVEVSPGAAAVAAVLCLLMGSSARGVTAETTAASTAASATTASTTTPATTMSCNSQSGPAGVSQCVLLNPTYNDYQWATCLSGNYISVISAGSDQCEDPTAQYCWYQCMLEQYNSMGPGVSGLCKCSPSTSNIISLTLPATCYSTTGTDCGWYSNCLAAKYQCNSTSAGSALQYGYSFCEMYEQYYTELSSAGQQWMNSVRQCITGCLVPLLRPYNSQTCDNVTQLALSTQASCYLGHGCYGGGNLQGQDQQNDNWKSICQLPLTDFFQVIQMINNSFSDYAMAGQSLCGAMNVVRTCTVSHSQLKSLNKCIRGIVVNVRYTSTSPPAIAAPYAVPSQIAGQIAQNQNWNAQGIQTLGCLTGSSWTSNSQLVVNVVVITKNNKNCLQGVENDDDDSQGDNGQGNQNNQNRRRKRSTSTTTDTTDLDQVISDFEQAVQAGRVLLNIDGQSVYVTGTGECDPLGDCSNTTAVTVAAPATPAGSSRLAATGSTAILVVAAILLAAFNQRHVTEESC